MGIEEINIIDLPSSIEHCYQYDNSNNVVSWIVSFSDTCIQANIYY